MGTTTVQRHSLTVTHTRGSGLLRPLLRGLVSPPIALSVDVSTPTVAETRRSGHDQLETVGAGFVASPRSGRDAHRVPFPELDDLVVELHPSAPAHDDVHLFLHLVRV